MKYLNLYEHIASIGNEYYTIIDANIFNEAVGHWNGNCVDFNDYEIDMIKEFDTTKYTYTTNQDYIRLVQKQRKDWKLRSDKKINILKIPLKIKDVGYIVCKTEDDWFYVKSEHLHPRNDMYYKCDQIDGVVKLFKEI